MTPEVGKFYGELNSRFLHFGGNNNLGIVDKVTPGGAIIYRKGVYVRTLEGNPSVFNYNFGDELEIDEARNLNDYACKDSAVKLILKSDKLCTMLQTLSEQTDMWECDASEWILELYAKSHKENVKKCWEKTFGDALIALNTHGALIERASRRGHVVIVIKHSNWYKALTAAGVPGAAKGCENINDRGYEVCDASDKLRGLADKVWNWIKFTGMTNNKPQPPVKMFSYIMSANQILHGYFADGTVYINKDFTHESGTLLEEYAHYITGSTDGARDFQTWAFEFGRKFAELVW